MKLLMLLTLNLIAPAGNSTAQLGGAATPPPGASAAATPSVKIESVWDFVVKGGPVMIPIGICSLIALTVIIERLFALRRDHVIPKGFLPELNTVMDHSGVHLKFSGNYAARCRGRDAQKVSHWPLIRWAMSAVMARAPVSLHCRPLPLSRMATSCLQVDSIMPEPIA